MIENLSENLKGEELFNVAICQFLVLISHDRNGAIIHKQGIAKLCVPLPRRMNYIAVREGKP